MKNRAGNTANANPVNVAQVHPQLKRRTEGIAEKCGEIFPSASKVFSLHFLVHFVGPNSEMVYCGLD